MMKELCCYVCDKKASAGTPGWESGPRDLCPKHRQTRPKALATLGELVAHAQARNVR